MPYKQEDKVTVSRHHTTPSLPSSYQSFESHVSLSLRKAFPLTCHTLPYAPVTPHLSASIILFRTGVLRVFVAPVAPVLPGTEVSANSGISELVHRSVVIWSERWDKFHG